MASDFPKDAPSIKDAKPRKKTNVKYDPHMKVMAPSIKELFDDPLADLWELHEAEMAVQAKPDLQDAEPPHMGGPNADHYEHPVTQQRNQVDYMRAQGMSPDEAHQAVHGNVDTTSVESKASFAATLGRVQDDGNKRAVKIEKEKQSIFAKDAEAEKALDQVTRDDLRTPMNQQVPDREQTPADQVAEELDYEEEYDYNLDVDYLQKFGRA